MSSSPETSPRTVGAHRAHREARDREAAHSSAQHPFTRHEPYLDGLFTYCLSVLRDHDAATAALAEALALAERRHAPEPADDPRAWLYALARWACLRRLAEDQRNHLSTHATGPHGTGQQRTGKYLAQNPAREPGPTVFEEYRQRRRSELALLAWPEAAGTTPEQREALELAVRHQLAPHEVAAVLGLAPAAARDLLASAACEVERTRAALTVVETGSCPSVTRLTGGRRFVLGTTLRHELVRHVDDCPDCRRTAERATPGRWPGTTVTPAALPVLEAPRAALRPAAAHPTRPRRGAPRFDRRGFPVDPGARAARRDRLRARAVTTTVVATVVAAPVFAFWAAYRGAPVTGEGVAGSVATAREAPGTGGPGGEAPDLYENAGNASARPDARSGRKTGRVSDVSGEVTSAPGRAAGELDVAVGDEGGTTVITLAASGRAPVAWALRTGQDWIYFSRSSGTLDPGETMTIKVYPDQLREPAGHWSARVSIAPTGTVVVLEGYGRATRTDDPRPAPPGPKPPPSDPSPTTRPAPDPDPAPGDPGLADPTPVPSGPGTPGPEGATPPPGDRGGPPAAPVG
jgi:DNA-directed RNA polymerase specialized sigma24 family protein